jgi:hydrogenase expression/formation protein HypC
MCLAKPGRIVRIAEDETGLRSAEVEYPGLLKSVSLLYLPEAKVGDHILVQAGFGIRLLTEDQAREVIAAMAALPPEAPAVSVL